MELFADTIYDLRDFLAHKDNPRSWPASPDTNWPSGRGRNVVLGSDMAVELGNPQMESVSCILWTEKIGTIRDNYITLIGPDLPESRGASLPFGKIVLIEVSGFDAENTYERYREMELVRYGLDLKGYMLRAVSQYRREWCRISHEAIDGGFCFDVLASRLIRKFKEINFVAAVECILVTSSPQDVLKLAEITHDTTRIIAAMNKMAQEMDFDCDTCEYQDVCYEATDLKSMREAYRKKLSDG